MERRHVLVIGLDGVPPEYLFSHRFQDLMPRTRALLAESVRAPLRTTDPPISVPAWPVMFTGVDPGTLGLYGFRHRVGASYTETYVPDSTHISVPTVWQLASAAGLRVGVVGMPMGFPPVKVNGFYISDFLTPPDAAVTTDPPELRAEIEEKFGPYRFDVLFRANARGDLFSQIVEMTRRRFEVAEYLYRREQWDLFGIHEIGTDRLNHAYTKFFDPRHAAFVSGNPLEHVIEQYYPVLDEGIGRLVDATPPNTRVVIASDHGSMPMSGCFCINQWLEQHGYLVLRHPVQSPTPLEKCEVDWSRTAVWGAGGYYARLFFNKRGRESRGWLDESDVQQLRARLEVELATIPGPQGQSLRARILDPQKIYQTVAPGGPDLMVYFDELNWRSAGSLGHPSNLLKENDTGPDDAVHSFHGVFTVSGLGPNGGRSAPAQKIIDVAPTILHLLDLPVPAHVQGRAISLLDDGGTSSRSSPVS